MRLQHRYHWLILTIAITIWIGVGCVAMALALPDRDARASASLWIVLFGVFAAALIGSVAIGQRSRAAQWALIAIEVLSVVAMGLTDRGSPGPLLTPIALQVALLFGTRNALLCVAVNTILLRLGLWDSSGDLMSWIYSGLDLSGELIAVGVVRAVRLEAEASLALGRANAELRATQALLAESAARDERTRISRELHDAWGHDLTALSLQLEYASHVGPEERQKSVVEARDLAKSLLAKVRDVVGTLRRYDGHDIKPVLQALATGTPQLKIHLEIPETLAPQSAEAAQTLMCSAQEIITNSLRHARARNLWLALRAEDGGVRLDGHDDGEGIDQLRLGHGLNGLCERFHQLGGRIAFESAQGCGFRVSGWIPTRLSHP
ncbi:MAG TPA: histidine kinase [Rhizomicrobium sp.]|jgi:signal transduction histidine kinase